MKIKTAVIATALLAAPTLAGAIDIGGNPATDTTAAQTMPGGMGMMGGNPRGGMMEPGMGMPGDSRMMEMMSRQQMMENRMDRMEMMMQRRQGMMHGGQGAPMMGGPRGGMGPCMDMQDDTTMTDRMANMRNMNPEQRKQMMQQRMDMMKAKMGMIQQRIDMMQQRMDMMDKQQIQSGRTK